MIAWDWKSDYLAFQKYRKKNEQILNKQKIQTVVSRRGFFLDAAPSSTSNGFSRFLLWK